MHEKEDVIDLNKNSYFHKIVSSIVLTSFLSMTVTQSYAMTEGLPAGNPSPRSSFSAKVIPLDDLERLEQGVVKGVPTDLSVDRNPQESFIGEIARVLGASLANPTKVAPELLPQEGGKNDSDPEILKETSRVKERSSAVSGDSKHDDEQEILSPDLETGSPKGSAGSSEIKEEDDECSDEKTKAFIKEAMRSDVSREDLRKIAGAFFLTLALGTSLWGFMELWVNSFVNAFDTTPEGYTFTFINRNGAYFIDSLIIAQKTNIALAFTPYVFYRSLEFIERLFPSKAESSVTRKFSNRLEIPATTITALCALATAADLGFQLYESAINYSELVAQTATAFFVPFVWIDFYLRYAGLKDSILNYLFVEKSATLAHLTVPKAEREKVIDAIHEDEKNRNALDRFFSSRKESIYQMDKGQVVKRSESLKKFENSPIKKVKKLLEKEKRDSLSVTEQASLLQKEHERNQALELRRTRNRAVTLFIGSLLGTAGAYLSFEGTQSTAQSGLQLTLPGGINSIGVAEQLGIYKAEYDVWLKATESIRTPPLTEVGGNYVNATYINGTYVNVDALNNWWTQCVDSAESYQYVNNSLGSNGFSFGYNCPGVSFTIADSTASPGQFSLNLPTAIYWYTNIDGSFGAEAGIKNENNDDYYVAHDVSISLPTTDKGIADFFSGVRAAASGALTIKSTGDTLNRMMNSFSMLPDEILPGKRNLWMNSGILFASLIESLVYASPNGVSAWLSMQNTNVEQGLMWTLVAATVASATLNVFPDFDEIYTRIPHDVKSLLYYTGVLKQKGPNYIRDEMLKTVGKMARAAASGTPEFRAALIEIFGLKDKTIQRRRAIMA